MWLVKFTARYGIKAYNILLIYEMETPSDDEDENKDKRLTDM